MTRRSPMHDRYRTGKVAGSTRRSAASAKPKRDAGKGSDATPKAKSGAKSSGLARVEQSEETRRLRRIWWVLILAAFGFAGLSLLVGKSPPWNTVVLVLYGTSLIGAFYLEFGPIRKSRLADREAAKSQAKSTKK